jgi:hypothetical protein
MPSYEFVATPSPDGYQPNRWYATGNAGNGQESYEEGVYGEWLIQGHSLSGFSEKPASILEESDFTVTFEITTFTEAAYYYEDFATTKLIYSSEDGRYSETRLGIQRTWAELPGDGGAGPYLGESPATNYYSEQSPLWDTTNSEDSALFRNGYSTTLRSYNVVNVETKISTFLSPTTATTLVPTTAVGSNGLTTSSRMSGSVNSWKTATGGVVNEISTESTTYATYVAGGQYVQTMWQQVAATTPVVFVADGAPAFSLVNTQMVEETTAETFWKTLPRMGNGTQTGIVQAGGTITYETQTSGDDQFEEWFLTRSTTGKYTQLTPDGPTVSGTAGIYVTSSAAFRTFSGTTQIEESYSDRITTSSHIYQTSTIGLPFLDTAGLVVSRTNYKTFETWNSEAYSESTSGVFGGLSSSRTEIAETPLGFKPMAVQELFDRAFHTEARKIELAMKTASESGGGAGYDAQGSIVNKQRFSTMTVEGLLPVTNRATDEDTTYVWSANSYTTFNETTSGTSSINTVGESTSYWSIHYATAPKTTGVPQLKTVYWAGGKWAGELIVMPGLYSTRDSLGGGLTNYNNGSRVSWPNNNNNITAFVHLSRFISSEGALPGPVESVTRWTAQPIDD